MRIWLVIVVCISVMTFEATSKIIRVPQDLPKIGAAIDSAAAGDTIRIAEGRYDSEGFLHIKRPVTIIGTDSSLTVIDKSYILISSVRHVIIQDIALKYTDPIIDGPTHHFLTIDSSSLITLRRVRSTGRFTVKTAFGGGSGGAGLRMTRCDSIFIESSHFLGAPGEGGRQSGGMSGGGGRGGDGIEADSCRNVFITQTTAIGGLGGSGGLSGSLGPGYGIYLRNYSLARVSNTVNSSFTMSDSTSIILPYGPSNVANNMSIADEDFRLEVFPNPANPATTFSFTAPRSGMYHTSIVDILGREVATIADTFLELGNHRMQWNAASVASGIYLCRVASQYGIAIQKFIVLK